MATAIQRPLKGSRISTFYPIKSVPALSTLDSAFQLQEFISLTIRSDIHDVSAIISVPDSRSNAEGGGSDDNSTSLTEDTDGDKDTKSEFAVDEACWIYEQLRYAELPCLRPSLKLITHSTRRLAQDLSHPLITMLQQECTRATCPEMKAGEWMYLCVAHGNDGAMEVRLCYSQNTKRKQKTFLMVVAAMLRHRLHSTHRRQRNSPSELATSLPITVRVTLAPSLFFGLFSLHLGSASPLPLIDTLARSPAASGVSSRMLTSTIARSSNKPRPNRRSTLASSR
jgi:hypothetical protein